MTALSGFEEELNILINKYKDLQLSKIEEWKDILIIRRNSLNESFDLFIKNLDDKINEIREDENNTP